MHKYNPIHKEELTKLLDGPKPATITVGSHQSGDNKLLFEALRDDDVFPTICIEYDNVQYGSWRVVGIRKSAYPGNPVQIVISVKIIDTTQSNRDTTTPVDRRNNDKNDKNDNSDNSDKNNENVPYDYEFLKWIWNNIEDFTKYNTIRLLNDYEEQTGKIAPYMDATMQEHCNMYYKQLSERKVPDLIEYITYETQNIPKDNSILIDITSSIVRYYGGVYAAEIFAQDKKLRNNIRNSDSSWEHKVLVAYSWSHRLESCDRLNGSTNVDEIRKMSDEWQTLTAIIPNRNYDIVKDGNKYVYDSDIELDTTNWESLVDRITELISQGYVIGPFVFDTLPDATEQQDKRVVCDVGYISAIKMSK